MFSDSFCIGEGFFLTNIISKINLQMHSQKTGVGFGSSICQGTIAMCHLVHGFFNAYSFMVGVLVSLRACRILDPVFQTSTSTAQSLEASGGSLKTTVKEKTMLQHSPTQKTSITPPQQADVIYQAAILSVTAGLYDKAQPDDFLKMLKADCIEMLRLLDKIPTTPTKKTLQSHFNVTNTSSQVLAKHVQFTKAKRLKDRLGETCLIKFAGMEVVQ